jgi:hypothetical protein
MLKRDLLTRRAAAQAAVKTGKGPMIVVAMVLVVIKTAVRDFVANVLCIMRFVRVAAAKLKFHFNRKPDAKFYVEIASVQKIITTANRTADNSNTPSYLGFFILLIMSLKSENSAPIFI